MDDQVPPPAGGVDPAAPAPPASPGPTFAGPTAAPPPAYIAAAPEPAKRRRSVAAVVTISLLAVALLAALGAGAWLTLQYLEAQDRIADQQQRIQEQNDEIEKQKDLIDEKQTFGAAMTGLMDTAAKFDGILTASVVPWHEYEVLADRGYAHRWDARKVAADTKQVHLAAEQLEALWVAAEQERQTNTTGTAYESVIDELGRGFVSSVIDEPDCGKDNDGILGCVFGGEPYVVHFDASGNQEPFMTDELRTGIAYHEFAHVLQFTNPEATEAVLPTFSGDFEVMADCFALTYLPGWKLDHRIWVSSYEYWDVNIGYGQDCSESQRAALRDWYGKLGVQLQSIPADPAA